MKKIIALLIALCLILGLCSAVFADQPADAGEAVGAAESAEGESAEGESADSAEGEAAEAPAEIAAEGDSADSEGDAAAAEDIEARVASQLPDDEKTDRADVIIRNDGTLEELYKQIDSRLK